MSQKMKISSNFPSPKRNNYHLVQVISMEYFDFEHLIYQASYLFSLSSAFLCLFQPTSCLQSACCVLSPGCHIIGNKLSGVRPSNADTYRYLWQDKIKTLTMHADYWLNRGLQMGKESNNSRPTVKGFS